MTFEVDHIIARKHGGMGEPGNLCLACFFCNAHKGANLSGIDPDSGKITPLFHPRRQKWGRHYLLARSRPTGPYRIRPHHDRGA